MIESNIFVYNSILDSDDCELDIGKLTFNNLASNNIEFNNGITNVSPSVAISDKGIEMTDSCDVKIGNLSLRHSIERIEQRLAILSINHDLEKEWEELKDLGNRYRQLEKDIKDKMSVWELLKKD